MGAFKKLFLLLFTIYLSAEYNNSKALAEWLQYGFTEADLATIYQNIKKIEDDDKMLYQRIAILEKNLLNQSNIVKALLLKRDHSKRVQDHYSHRIERFKPSLFITVKKAPLYDRPNHRIVMTFPKRYKFTSFIRKGPWIRVTGHFPKKRWEEMKKSLWIREDLIKKI